VSARPTARRYGKCLVEREIGRGARATVYLAWHESLQIPVAVKVITKENAQDDEHFSERFMREARIAAQLSHSHIVRVYDCGENDAEYYLVMEYVEGESCKDKMEQWGAFDWQRGVQITRQVAEGLRYANKKGIIHRDIKPENIMIGTDGDARIADLGLAKQVVKGRGSATADGDVLGTPYYMSPEQVRQPSDVDFHSDIYSLGATLYHMVSGEVPFEAATPYEIMTKHLNEPVTSPAETKPDLPAALCDLIVRAMSKAPEDRQQSYDELAADLDALLEADQAPSAHEDFMGVVEASLEDEAGGPRPATAAARIREQAEPRLRPIRPVELPVTAQNIASKLLGVLGVLAYVFWTVCVHRIVLANAGAVVAGVVMAAVLLLTAGWGYLCTGRRSSKPDAPGASGLDDHVSFALGRLCERLDLPTPSVRVSNRLQYASFSYSFFSRKATLRIPGKWFQAEIISDQEREALIVQALAGVYTGDSDLRTLLAVPTGLLIAGGWLFGRLLDLTASLRPVARERAAHGMALAGLIAACGAIAVLFSSSVMGGLLALLFFGVLLVAAGFERSTRFVGDAFGAKVVGSEGAVKSVIVAQGLAGVEGRRLILESEGREPAEQWSGKLPSPEARAELAEGIAAHYSEVEYSPSTLEMASKLFSVTPFAADRLNRLAGIPRRRSRLMGTILTAKRIYAGLLATSEKRATCMADLAGAGQHALLGAIGGLLAVAATALFVLAGASEYVSFVVSAGVLGCAMGCFVAPKVCRQGMSPGRMGWAVVVAGVSFTCIAMVGFSLFGGPDLSGLAVQCPIGLVLIILLAGASAAVLVRLAPALGFETHRGTYDFGFKTAHTLVMPFDGRKAPAKPSRAPAEAATPEAKESEGSEPSEGEQQAV
jgi:tRNA A-37 threonylcarbamoyl transferase component Bud32